MHATIFARAVRPVSVPKARPPFATNLCSWSNVMTHADDVDAFLMPYPPEVQALAHAAREFLAQVLPGAAETIDESAKLLGYGYGPGYRGLVCTLLLSKTGIKLGIAHAATLPDPRQLLQGSGKVHRYVGLLTADDLKQPGLKPLMKAALAAWKKRTQAAG